MKIPCILLVVNLLQACGDLDSNDSTNSASKDSCSIQLNFSHVTQKSLILDGSGHEEIRDHLTYRTAIFNEKCQDFIGENAGALDYHLTIKSRPSAASIYKVGIDQKRFVKFANGEKNLGNGDLNLFHLRQEDWVAPIDRLEDIFVEFLFPMESERSLYPTSVTLVMNKR